LVQADASLTNQAWFTTLMTEKGEQLTNCNVTGVFMRCYATLNVLICTVTSNNTEESNNFLIDGASKIQQKPS
jgi:hypothetical protein